jgi:uncharacterized membrane protein SirB2
MKKILLTLLLASILILPVATMAQIGGDVPDLTGMSLTDIGEKIAEAAWIVFTIIAVIAFVIAGVLFLTSAGNAEKIVQARTAFLWGVAGVVVGIMAFGIITIITSIF